MTERATVVAYSQCLLLANVEELPGQAALDYAAATGLIGNDPSLMILTGVATGAVEVEIRQRDDPGSADPERWEDIAEVGIEVVDGPAVLLGPATGNAHPTPLAEIDGRYWLRVSATGRDLETDLVATVPPREHYLLEVWPDASHRAPHVVQSQSNRARLLRSRPSTT